MEKQIMNMLNDIQRNIKELDSNMKELESNMKELRTDVQADMREFRTDVQADMMTLRTDVKDIKETVNRIEASQTEDVIAMLKVGAQRSETDFRYLNTRITDIDKRVFTLENRPES
ncbi:hypothetical protein KJK41_04815 [Bacillus haikouensis]|nr:hypothetical protein KJK41_04815 [Bacillus haikouensis]